MQKITPCLWFDSNTEEAVSFYTSVFKNSKVGKTAYYDEAAAKVSGQKAGSVLTVEFQLEGYDFLALNGGPAFKFTPSISFSVNCETEEEIDGMWKKLSEGGKVLMEFQKYPFSEKYGWCEDRYGVSWQLSLGKSPQKITPSLLFTQDKAGKVEEAINFYTSLFENSKVETIARYEKDDFDKEGMIKYSLFTMSGEYFTAMESTLQHEFTFNEAISLSVDCADQEEVDTLWNKLIADGGEESQCGWLKDKYGVSWQIVPKQLVEYLSDPDREKARRVMQAMLAMKKISVEDLQKAYEGKD
jgi:predicted 3-demethylubiquinone-9 3-methyltransferase (glyoxalase superfamily)